MGEGEEPTKSLDEIATEEIELEKIARLIFSNEKTKAMIKDSNKKDILEKLRKGKMVVYLKKDGNLVGCSINGSYFFSYEDSGKIKYHYPERVFFTNFIPVIEDGEIKKYKKR